MIAHVASVEGTREQLDRFATILESEVSPRIRTRKGFVQSITLMDRDGGRGMLITIWESQSAADASSEQWQREGATRGASSDAGLQRSARWFEVVAVTPAEG